MPWDQLSRFLVSHSHRVQPARGDGFYFLNAIELVLYCDYEQVVTVDDMVTYIIEHLATNADYYKQLHTGDLLQDAEEHCNICNYCDNIIDVIIVPAKALHINLSIYQKGPDANLQVIEEITNMRGRAVH